jgi:predicted ATPase
VDAETRRPQNRFVSTSDVNNNLSTTMTRVIGREKIIDVIGRDVGATRLVSIVGAGGIGKTTVALAVAELAVESFRDGVWFVDIAPVREASLVPNVIATALGLVVHSADIMTALCRFLRGRKTLLVLDNCEHMVEAIAACVTRVLDESAGVHVLATSRGPLRVTGEQVHRLPGLESPPSASELTATEAMAFPAIELFVERAADRLESFKLTDADVPAVAEICRSLDGIALAIELAAMRVDVFGVRGLQKQLEDRFQALGAHRAGLERHRTLAATLDWSYSLLPPEEARVLCAVSVFAGVLRLDDARAISKLSFDDTAKILTELAAQSLLSVDTEAKEVSYRPLETTRAYCLDKLLASGADPEVRTRHAEYICAVVERAADEVATLPALEWGVKYGRYLDDLRCALMWAGASARGALLVRLTAAGTALWNHFSLTSESRTHLKRAIAELRQTGSDGEVEMKLQLALAGAILYTQGIVPEAREAMEHAREIAIHRDDAVYHLNCLRMIGTYQLFSQHNATGIETLDTFVTMALAKDPAAVAEGETHLGCGEMFIGRLRLARERLERLYAQGLPDLNDSAALRFFYHNSINVMIVLSHVQWLTGSPASADRTATMVVEYGLVAHHELSLTIGLAWICLVNFWTGRDEECARHAAMLDDLVERHGIVTWRPIATFCRGALASMRAETLAEGIADLERTVAECRAIGHMARLPYYMSVLAEALTRRGRLAEAEAVIEEALALATKWDDNWSLPEMLRIHAFVLAARGRPAEQESTLVAAMALADKLGALSWQLRAAIDLARLWRAGSRTTEAKQMLRPVVDAFTEGFEMRDVAIATTLLAELE